MNNKLLLDQIIKRCKKELPEHPRRHSFPHWCFLTDGSSILAVAINKAHEPNKKYGYHGKEYRPTVHAELAAVLKYRKRTAKKMYAVNVRLGRQGDLRIACPCKPCRDILKLAGVSRVYFSTEYGWGDIRLS